MVPHAAAKTQYQLHPHQVCKSRLLLISDTPTGLLKLRSLFGADNLEIAGAILPQDLFRMTQEKHDMAVIDVNASQILGVLKTLRGSAEHRDIPVLVEASRIVTDPNLAGVLPTYRAMPCGQSELIQLVRNQVSPARNGRAKSRLL
ncbi:MAG TPA: hypothetical protein VJ302_22175 [Blastocatellia bacterium]|nr:hypothetical protein [Blastocatellia bacterium]